MEVVCACLLAPGGGTVRPPKIDASSLRRVNVTVELWRCEMRVKGLIVTILLAMLAGCAGMGGETSGGSGESSAHGAPPPDNIFRSYIN